MSPSCQARRTGPIARERKRSIREALEEETRDRSQARRGAGGEEFVARFSRLVAVAGLLTIVGCHGRLAHESTSRDGATRPAPDARGRGAPDDEPTLAAILRAEDERQASAIRDSWLVSPDVVVRRRAVRALARIAEPLGPSEENLRRALGDEDVEVVAWAAYGLGWACKGREDAHVRALSARAVALADVAAKEPPGTSQRDPSDRSRPDARASIYRAIGRCGGALAESVLVGFWRAPVDESAPAEQEELAYGLGSLAGRGPLTDETLGALLDRAAPSSEQASPAVAAAALYPLGRLERVPDAWTARVLGAARSVLARSSGVRAFAIRALEKVGALGVPDLEHAVVRTDLLPSERAEAARALGRLGAPGRAAASAALRHLFEDGTHLAPALLAGDTFNVLLATTEALGQDPAPGADKTLYALASWKLDASLPPGIVRRLVALRCAAGASLARAAYDAPVLATCDPDPAGSIGQRARLAALTERPLVGERRKAFHALGVSLHLDVREALLEAVALHPELAETGRLMLVQGLGALAPGVVAAAAQAIVLHPERVLTLAPAERRAALDPRAPPPSTRPAMDLPPDVATALSQALARRWREDAVETRTSLLDAAVAVSLPDARAIMTRACTDPNATVREHATRGLRALGQAEASCPRAAAGDEAPSLPVDAAVLAHPTHVTFDIEGQKLAIVFEPDLAPLAATRFVALARAGFYKGTVVHRVVPGYVVQFGDPAGDGYGGSGALLRCETSPVPFDAQDVGVALAGRDTGSSQVFVTLGRFPKLDGDYARVGRAQGDWSAVAEGDVIAGVQVEE